LPLFFYWGGFDHAAGRPITLTAGLAAGALLLAIASASVAWWRGKSQVGRTQAALLAIAILVPLATYVWMVSWHGRYAEPFQRVGYRCFAMTIASGAPLLAAALWLRKRTVANHPVAGGAALELGARPRRARGSHRFVGFCRHDRRPVRPLAAPPLKKTH